MAIGLQFLLGQKLSILYIALLCSCGLVETFNHTGGFWSTCFEDGCHSCEKHKHGIQPRRRYVHFLLLLNILLVSFVSARNLQMIHVHYFSWPKLGSLNSFWSIFKLQNPYLLLVKLSFWCKKMPLIQVKGGNLKMSETSTLTYQKVNDLLFNLTPSTT